MRRNLASLWVDLGRLDEAWDAAEAGGSPTDRAWHQYTLGQVAIERGDLDAAEELLVAAGEAHRTHGFLRGWADSRNLLGDLSRKRGRPEEAEERYLDALGTYRWLEASAVGVIYANLALARMQRGHHERARRDPLRAEAELRSVGWIPMVAAMQITRG